MTAKQEQIIAEFTKGLSELMRSAIESAVNDAPFSRETFLAHLRNMGYESLDQVPNDKFKAVCALIVTLERAYHTNDFSAAPINDASAKEPRECVR